MTGDIVVANHYDLFNHYKLALFLIIYDEELDDTTNHCINVTALRITSKHNSICYNVPIDLKVKSNILCSKLYTLNKSQIIKTVGHIDNLKDVTKELNKYYKEMIRQCTSY